MNPYFIHSSISKKSFLQPIKLYYFWKKAPCLFKQNRILMNKKLKFPVIILLLIFLSVNIQCRKEEKSDDPNKDLKIGDHFQGGTVFYIFKSSDDGYDHQHKHGLIAAPDSLETRDTWGNTGIKGASETGIGCGKENTKEIASASGGCAARYCYNLVFDGYDDWYLPSLVELNQLYIQRDIIGGFKPDYYWSSTKREGNSDDDAWTQDFYSGKGAFMQSYFGLKVRPIRSF